MERRINATKWMPKKHLCPIENLEAAATEDGRSSATLDEMLWLMNAHPELPGFLQICRHAREALSLLPESTKHNEAPSDASVQPLPLDMKFNIHELRNWIPILDWVTGDSIALAERVFPSNSDGYKGRRERFLETAKNPVASHGAKRHGLYCMLWASHPGETLRKPFRLLQAHVLMAHISVMSHATTLTGWANEEEPWTNEDDPREKFYLSLYRPTWLTRRFTQLKEGWPAALRMVMMLGETPPPEDQIITLGSRLHKMSEKLWDVADSIDAAPIAGREGNFPHSDGVNATTHSLRGLAGFLARGIDPANYVNRRRPNSAGNGSGGGKTLGGAGDTQAVTLPSLWGLGKMKMVYGDPDDRQEPTVTVHLPARWQRRPQLYKRLVEAGDHPAEELCSQRVQLAEDAAGAAMAAGGGIEMAHQLLPWAYQNLSIGELTEFLCRLEALSARKDPSVLEIRALVNVMLWTGASFEQALSLYIFLDETPDFDCDLALRIRDYVSDGPVVAEWQVRALTLLLKTVTQPPAIQARERVYFFTLPDAVGGAGPVQDFLNYMRVVANEHLAQPEIMKERPLRVFRHEVAWYRKMIRETFLGLDKVGRITTTRISRVLFQILVEQTGEDIVSAALITGTDHSLASVRRYYDTPEVWHLQQTYINATTTLKGNLAAAGYQPVSSEPLIAGRKGVTVGSPLCPTLKAMQDAIQWLKDEVKASSAADKFLQRHNMYTLYSVWCFGFAVGMRGVRTPYLYSDAIDDDSGLAAISDKDNGTGYRSRLVWLPPFVRDQMRRYEFYLSNIADCLDLPAATRKKPCYFLDEHAKTLIVSPRTMVPLLNQFFPFPANVARHLVSTELKERGVAPEMISAWLGHYYRGQEPWGPYSSFSFRDYRQELGQVLCPFLTEVLGFEPMPPQGLAGER